MRAKGCVYYIYHKKVLSVTDFRLKHVNCYSVCVGLPERERERENISPVQRSKPSKTAFGLSKKKKKVRQLLIDLIVSLCISTRIQTIVKVSYKLVDKMISQNFILHPTTFDH